MCYLIQCGTPCGPGPGAVGDCSIRANYRVYTDDDASADFVVVTAGDAGMGAPVEPIERTIGTVL